jgi:hypothetical protein
MCSVSRIRKAIKIPRGGIGGGKEKVAHAGEAGLGGAGLGAPNSIVGGNYQIYLLAAGSGE